MRRASPYWLVASGPSWTQGGRKGGSLLILITAPPPHNPILPLVCILQITPLLPPLTLTTKASKQNPLSGHVPLALCLYFLTIPWKYPPAMFSSSPSLSSWESSPPGPPSPPGPRKHSTGVQLRCLKRFPKSRKNC